MTSASTDPRAVASTSAGRPASCASSPRNAPRLWVTIGARRPDVAGLEADVVQPGAALLEEARQRRVARRADQLDGGVAPWLQEDDVRLLVGHPLEGGGGQLEQPPQMTGRLAGITQDGKVIFQKQWSQP